MQNDGNLVIYDRYKVPVWASNTNGYTCPGTKNEFETVVTELVKYPPLFLSALAIVYQF